ncbi:MAG: 4-hydroxy-3-methylbut-2-enyl diphosphate reductase, partial [Clostridiales bacterium]|nr:4-hydroxy-3-methylbut-2-enyl diphosphate reductase [Clostridiales bacterium]
MTIQVAKSAGFCFGVKRAVDTVLELIKNPPENTTIYTIGKLIHNPQIIATLTQNGVQSIDETQVSDLLLQCDANHRMIFVVRAHGIEKTLQEQLLHAQKENPHFQFIDCTCPYVKKIHTIVQENSAFNKALIVIGQQEHPEVKGIISYATGPVYVFPNEEAILHANIPEKQVFMVAQTTQNTAEWKKCQKITQKLCTKTQIFDTICSVTENRQKEAATLSKKVDIMLVIGGKESSNTNKLYQIAKENCDDTFFVEGAAQLPVFENWPAAKVGIVAGASTPYSIIKEVET